MNVARIDRRNALVTIRLSVGDASFRATHGEANPQVSRPARRQRLHFGGTFEDSRVARPMDASNCGVEHTKHELAPTDGGKVQLEV